MSVKSVENFPETFEKKFHLKNEVLSEYSNTILNYISSSCFVMKLFFKGLEKTFCGLYGLVQGFWKVLLAGKNYDELF